MNHSDTGLTESEFFKMVWDYFVIHANQRMQILNFYIVLETFFITGLLTLFQLDGELTAFRFIVCIAIIFFFDFLCIRYENKSDDKIFRRYIKNNRAEKCC